MRRSFPSFDFSPEKNKQLIEARGISFEEIIAATEEGFVLDIINNYNLIKYPGQRMYVIEVREYVYLVPFVILEGGTIFLNTIIPSRKASRYYLGKEK